MHRTHGWRHHLVGLAVVVAVGIAAFGRELAVPGLATLDLVTQEFGDLVAVALGMSELAEAMMGPLVQIGVPLLAAVLVFATRRDLLFAGLLATWASHALLDVSRYAADAPTRSLVRLGGEHDFALLLGVDGFDRMEWSSELATLLRIGSMTALLVAVVLVVGGLLGALSDDRRRRTLSAVPVRTLDWTPVCAGRAPAGRRVHAR